MTLATIPTSTPTQPGKEPMAQEPAQATKPVPIPTKLATATL